MVSVRLVSHFRLDHSEYGCFDIVDGQPATVVWPDDFVSSVDRACWMGGNRHVVFRFGLERANPATQKGARPCSCSGDPDAATGSPVRRNKPGPCSRLAPA